MKLIFFTTMSGSPWGGSEELWYQTALSALKAGHVVMISVIDWGNEPAQITNLRNKGALIHKRLVQTKSRLSKRIINKLTKSLKAKQSSVYKELLNFKPDIVYISQGGTFDFLQDDYYYFIKQLKAGYAIICHHNYESGGILDDFSRDRALDIFNNAVNVFFVSRRNLQTAERQLASKLNNTTIIQNPVKLQKRKVIDMPVCDSKLTMACVARLECAFKGQDILLQTLSDVSWRNRDYELNLYGSGPDYSYLAKLIECLDLGDKVFLKGHEPNIEKIWLENQILILSSLSEGTPLSLIEAMLCGRCALTTDVGDMGEYVIDQITGFLVPNASIRSLSNGLEQVWQNKGNLSDLGLAAYNYAQQKIETLPEQPLLNILTNFRHY